MSKLFNLCLILLQLSVINIHAENAVSKQRYTQYVWEQPVTFESLSLSSSPSRGPASAIPSDHIESMPVENKIWLSQVWVEDNSGVMNSMKNQVEQWERMEEYRRNWDIGSTNLYVTPDREQKQAWFNRMILRYADKRLSGELKNAEEGSTLQRVRSVKKALKPDTEAQISQNIKLKFKARVLRMRAIMRVVNPWVECETTLNARGEVHSRIGKTFQDLGVRADLNYQVNDGTMIAQLSKPLGNNITAVLSRAQSENEQVVPTGSDNTLQLMYSTPF